MNNIKIAFFDIDGTLVGFRTHEISRQSTESLDALRRNGVKVFIASGRHKILMDNLRDYPFDGYVCMNGALIIAGDEIIYRHPLSREDVARAKEAIERHSIASAVFSEDRVSINRRTDVVRRIFDMIGMNAVTDAPLDESMKDTVYQLTPFVTAEEEKLLTDVLDSSVSVRWHPEFTDIIPDDLSKAEGMARVLERYGFSREESIAFGDGGNDREMLQYAGIGVAMGNAADDVKACADYVTSSVDEDGVTAALKHFGLI